MLEGRKNTHLPPDLMELLRPSPVDPPSTPGAHPERERGVPSGHSAGRQCGQVLKPKPYGAVAPGGGEGPASWVPTRHSMDPAPVESAANGQHLNIWF